MRALAVLLLFTGCATTQQPQTTVVSGVKTETVFKSVLEPCVFVDEIPKIPGTWMNEGQSKEQRRAAALADMRETEDYILRADSLLRGCAKPREAK